jgi:very-short-patch-repair endonuclease
MARESQQYVTGLLEELLGPAQVEKRFGWPRGASRGPSRLGVSLPFDAVWERRKLIVEIDERQHGESVRFFDKPEQVTVSGVHRGEQRRLYDERKERLAREHGYTVVRIPTCSLAMTGRALTRDREKDQATIRHLLGTAGVRLAEG